MSIVIFARGHGSGSVDRQCNNSDVSSGAIPGSSPSFGRYCMAAAADLGVGSSIACLGHVRHHVELGSEWQVLH